MNLQPIRGELLAQHTHLRRRIEAVRAALGRWRGVESPELRALVSELAESLRAHNQREEELLHGVLSKVDAWGPVREELMDEGHAAEHQELAAALFDPEALRDDGRVLVAILGRVMDHMAREEKTFLSEALLCGEGAVAEQFSG